MPSLSVASAIAAFNSSTLAAGTRISDNNVEVSQNIDALQAMFAAGLLAGIDLNGAGREIIAVTPAQAAADSGALGVISSKIELDQSITAAQAASATLASGFLRFAVVDTAANIVANLPAIQALAFASLLDVVRITDGSGHYIWDAASIPVFNLSAAQVSANMDALGFISTAQNYQIHLTDGGTPTIIIPVWDGNSSFFRNVISQIQSPFNLTYGGPIRPQVVASIEVGVDRFTNQLVSGLPANPIAPLGTLNVSGLPSNMTILEWQARITNYLDSLQLAAAAGKISSIQLRDGGLNLLSVTPAQLTSDATAISLLTPNYAFSQIITASQTATTLAAGFLNFTVQDSIANILANVSAIDALARKGQLGKTRFTETNPDIVMSAAQLAQAAYVLSFGGENPARTITLSDAGTPVVTIAADVLANSAVRASVLNDITNGYTLNISGYFGAANAAALVTENNKVLSSLAANGLHVADFANNVVSNLASLQVLAAAGKLASVDLLNGGVPNLNISGATATADALALAKITSPYTISSTTAPPQSLSSSSLLSQLDSLETQAAAATLGPITLTDGGTPNLTISAAQFQSDIVALSKINSPYTVTIPNANAPSSGPNLTITLAPWQVNASTLTVLAHTSYNGAKSLAFSGPLSAAEAGALGSITTGFTFSGPINVVDSSGSVVSNEAAIQSLTTVATVTIQLTDSGNPTRIAVNAAQVAAAPAIFGASSIITSPWSLTESVTAGSAVGVASGIPGGGYNTVTVIDSAANIQSNLSSLEAIALNGKLNSVRLTDAGVFNISAATFAADFDVLRLISGGTISLTDTGTPDITLQNWQISSGLTVATNPLTKVNTLFTFKVNGDLRENFAASLDSSSVISHLDAGGLIVRDWPNNFPSVLTLLEDLAVNGKIASVDTRGGIPYFSLTTAQYVTVSVANGFLSRFNTPYILSKTIDTTQLATPLDSHFRNFTVQDSWANFIANLPAIEALASQDLIGRVAFTDVAPRLVLSAAQFMANADVFMGIDANPYPVVFTDAGAPVITLHSYQLNFNMRNDVLDTIATPWTLQISDSITAGLAGLLAEESNDLLTHLGAPMHIADSGLNFSNYIDQVEYLARLGKISSISLLDTGTPVVYATAAQQATDTHVFGGLISTAYTVVTIGSSTPQTRQWGGGSGNWSVGSNWVGGIQPNAGDSILFAGGPGGTITNSGTIPALNNLTFTDASAGWQLSGLTLTLSGGIMAGDTSYGSGTIDASTIAVNGVINVGNQAGGSGTLAIINGGRVTQTGLASANYQLLIGEADGTATPRLAAPAYGVVFVGGAGSKLDMGVNGIRVGNRGVGYLVVQSGGTVVSGTGTGGTTGPAALAVARQGGYGYVSVDGTGSLIQLNGTAYVGRAGSGVMQINNGGTVLAGLDTGGLGNFVVLSANTTDMGGNGHLEVDGAGSLLRVTAGTVGTSGNLTIGQGQGTGQVTVHNGGSIDALGRLIIGNATASGTPGVAGFLFFPGNGALNIANGGTVQVGGGNIGTGATTASGIFVGNQAGDVGRVTIGGGGVLRYTAAGNANAYGMIIGNNGAANGLQAANGFVVVDGTGALLDMANNAISIGHGGGNGTLNILNGGTVNSVSVNSGSGTATVAGIAVGRVGTGTVLVSDAGSSLNVTGGSYIGRGGPGNMTVRNGGTATFSADVLGFGGLGIGQGDPANNRTGGHGYLSVTGINSKLVLNLGTSTGTGGNLSIGLSGNTGEVDVTNGGTIVDHARLIVGSNTVVTSGTISSTINGVGTLVVGSGSAVQVLAENATAGFAGLGCVDGIPDM